MSSFLSELADYISREGIVSSSGSSVDIFVDKYPDTPNDLVALLGQISPRPDINKTAPLEYPSWQILVRDTDYVTGETKMRTIRTLLDKRPIVTENFVCLIIGAISDIIPIGQDNKGRSEFSLNMSAEMYLNDSG